MKKLAESTIKVKEMEKAMEKKEREAASKVQEAELKVEMLRRDAGASRSKDASIKKAQKDSEEALRLLRSCEARMTRQELDKEKAEKKAKDLELKYAALQRQRGHSVDRQATAAAVQSNKPGIFLDEKSILEGWVVAYTPEGRVYYQNRRTRATQWQSPYANYQQSPKPFAGVATEWPCSICTLNNPMSSKFCTACGTAKGSNNYNS
jgi:hypothetical protein